MSVPALVERLRAAGCVFAEDEAGVLRRAAPDAERLEAWTLRREAGEPLEQVVGQVAFGRQRLAVGPGVFVPRQRSLLLARAATRLAARQARPVLLEACAGVAPIASTVAARVPGVEVHASDVDPAALAHATRNLPAGAGVHVGHLLDPTPPGLRGRVTLLVAVPPYVPLAAAALLPREAREHEPARALFGGPDGLDHVRELIDGARPWLDPQGRVLLELSAAQYPAAAAHAARAGLLARRRAVGDGRTVVLDLALAG